MNKKFNEYLNMKHDNIKFTNEKVVNESLPFLDLLISRNKKGFTRTVYHKPTCSANYSNFDSFIALKASIATLHFLKFNLILNHRHD